jgi:hypothetical protein
MAIGKSIHQHVLKSEVFQANNIGLVIDELHAVDEWGTEDFRVAYSKLATLIKHLPTGVLLMMASVTLPPNQCHLQAQCLHPTTTTLHFQTRNRISDFPSESSSIKLALMLIFCLFSSKILPGLPTFSGP